jgi:hypothetical protein
MLTTWLLRGFFWALRLILPPSILPPPPKAPKPAKLKPLSVDERCLACFHKGTVTVEHVTVSTNPGKPGTVKSNVMRFSCSYCRAFWDRKPQYAVAGPGGRSLGPDEIHGREIRGLTA